MQNTLIAIIEDEPAIKNMYELKLKANGYKTITASDGIEALQVIEKSKPSLILLDLKIPHLPGNEVLKRVREHKWGKDIKVIVLTNISKSEAPADLRLLNVDRYIVKVQYTPSQVVDIVKEVLKS